MRTLIFIIVFLFFAADACANDIKKGNRLYEQGDYDSAISRYEQVLTKDPESGIVNFNLGTAHYKKGNYRPAIDHLQKSLLSDDPDFRERAHYNLGNSFFKFGLAQEGDNLKSAVSSLEQSVSQYENALKLDKEDADARHNYEVAKKELERLKQKQKQQQEQPPEQPKPDEAKEKDQGKQPNQGDAPPQPQPSPENKEKSSEGSSGNDRIDNPPPDSSSAEDMSKKEAEQLLNSYQRSEEPRGLLNFMKGKPREAPVLKDW
jgi:Ca-activated chloride channel homolog